MVKTPSALLYLAVLGVPLLYLGFCAALYLLQRSLLYFPQPRSPLAAGQVLSLPIAGGQVLVTARPHSGTRALIYFGGNAEDVATQLPLLTAAFPEHGLYLLHYRGYGGSSGRPSEAGLLADALALFDRVHGDHAQVTVMGRSLGSGVAVHLAAHRPVSRLVLVTPFDSIEALAAARFPLMPISLLLQDKYRSWQQAPRVSAPTLLIAAERDEVIPRASTEALLASFRPGIATLVVLPVFHHNGMEDCPAYLTLLRGVA